MEGTQHPLSFYSHFSIYAWGLGSWPWALRLGNVDSEDLAPRSIVYSRVASLRPKCLICKMGTRTGCSS